MKLPVYLDYAATTPVEPRVAEKMGECLTLEGCFANPASSSHVLGLAAADRVREAREQVAALLHADAREIIWTSGATEAINLAIKGVMQFYKNKGNHLITCKTEHKAVLDTCQFLQQQGCEVTYLEPQSNGLIDLMALKAAIKPETILVSLMHVNNETGVIQDIAAISELTRAQGIIFHVDAAQSAGKIAIDLQQMPIDLLSLSAHKLYGPKGIGALYVRHKPRARLLAQIHGGGHEQGLRSGTLATHQIVGMGTACHIAKQELPQEALRIQQLRERLWSGIKSIQGILLNGDLEARVPGILNVSFAGMDGEALLYTLTDLAVSSGSACTSATIETSHVLRAMGRSDAQAYSAIRFSLGRYTTAEEIDYAILQVNQAVSRLRAIAASLSEIK